MREIVVAVLVVVSIGLTTPALAQSELCDMLRTQPRVPQDDVWTAAALLRDRYQTWAADVPPAAVDPRSNSVWPAGFGGQECTVFANNQITVPTASCATVKNWLVDAHSWRDWYSNVADVDRKQGETLSPGTKFQFTTFGSRQTCTVVNADDRLVSWTCDNTGNLGHIHHRWNCSETSDGVLISTQECQNGPAMWLARLTRPAGGAMKDTMQRGHQVWLEGLRCKLQDHNWHITPAP